MTGCLQSAHSRPSERRSLYSTLGPDTTLSGRAWTESFCRHITMAGSRSPDRQPQSASTRV